MATIKLIGLLTKVFPIELSPKFTKKLFWITEPGTERYPNHWELELHQQDTGRLQGIEIGDRLECECEVRGRKWAVKGEDRIFTSLKCVGIKMLQHLETVPGKYKAKPGAEPQPELPL